MVDRRGEQTLVRCSRRVNGTLLEGRRSIVQRSMKLLRKESRSRNQVSLIAIGIRKLAEHENRSNRFFFLDLISMIKGIEVVDERLI